MATASFRDAIILARGRAGLIANVAVLLGVTIAINGFLFAVGWAGAATDARRMPMIPPGWMVGLIWTVLLALMGAARWLYVRITGDSGWRSWSPFVLAAVCIAYPFYTNGLQPGAPAFWGTVLTIVATLATIFVLRTRDWRSPWLLLPTACWGGYVVCVMLAYPA
jgi:tryptophan-rich sensory protein